MGQVDSGDRTGAAHSSPAGAGGALSPLAVGIVSVPHSAVPPERLGSISYVVHQISRHLAPSARLTIVAGTHGREPRLEVPGVAYSALADRFDRWLGDRWTAIGERLRGRVRHPFHREEFHAAYARAAARRLREAGCQVVFATVYPQWLKWLRRELPDAALVLWAHDATFACEGVGRGDELECADGVIACSRFVASRYAERCPRLRDHCHAVHNGVDAEEFHPDPAARSAPPTLCYAGRITPEKGVHVLVDAFAQLAGSHPDLELHLAGPLWVTDPALLRGTDPAHLAEIRELAGDYPAALKRRAGRHADRLHLRGPLSRPELRGLYSRSIAFVHPALWEEPFGMPVLEAMACGTPVVVTRRGGVPEFVEHGTTGYLVDSGDAAAIARRIEPLLADPSLRDSLGQAARHRAVEDFSWQSSARTLRNLLPSFSRAGTSGQERVSAPSRRRS